MRVLVVASPMVGHVLPLVPLALAFRDAGHDVRVATGADGLDAARRAGAPVHDVSPGVNVSAVFLRTLALHPLRLGRMMRGADEGTDGVGLMFAGIAARMAARTLALVDEWRPDLVLHEPLAGAGPLAAARAGAPAVLVDANLFDPEQQRNSVVGNLGRLARNWGLGALPPPAEVLRTSPASLVGERRGRPMRYVAAGGGGAVPDGLLRPSARPTVLVSRSTVADPRPDRLMSTVVDAAATAEVDVVLIRPDRRVAGRTLPPNVRTTEWLPHAAVLPHVAGIVHHGGAGTVMTALAAGAPQIVVPGPGDRRVNARLVADRGAGLAVPLADLTAASLERLARDPELASTAREVAAEIAAMPAPAQLVESLADLGSRTA
jgi:UDP:flavonoid glycosyltransferase YjiC (YdhE family)